MILISLLSICLACNPPSKELQEKAETIQQAKPILTGADQLESYLPLLKDKKVGLLVNHTSMIGDVHLVDTLMSLGISIPKIFTPEHGFRGKADAGEHVVDEKTEQYELISLFGTKREPSDDDVDGLDIIVFDIQDVGVRFYTYISSMHFLMDAAARNNIPFVVLDRPNPNGSYVDGPFLKEDQRSFVGLHPIPIVHGLTVGELAKMIVGEKWLKATEPLSLTVIPTQNWKHSDPFSLPTKPSPNLPNDLSIALYPSICLFEGTKVSVGRGTPTPFQHIGHPDYPDSTYSFIPSPMEGAKSPKLEGIKCFGVDYSTGEPKYEFTIEPLVQFYIELGQPKNFFNNYLKLLAGDLDDQIKAGMTTKEIQATWQDQLNSYKEMREGYLLY